MQRPRTTLDRLLHKRLHPIFPTLFPAHPTHKIVAGTSVARPGAEGFFHQQRIWPAHTYNQTTDGALPDRTIT